MRNALIKVTRTIFLSIGQGAFDLAVSLLALIIVERSCGQLGLGIFSYLLSIYFIVGYISEFGVPDYLESKIAVNPDAPATQFKELVDAYGATILLSSLCAGGFWLSAVYNTTHTRIEEKIVSYLILGLSILFRNINGVKLAFLQGMGKHDTAASLKIEKRGLFLGIIFILTTMFPFFGKNPSYLILAFLVSELFLSVRMMKTIKLPAIKEVWLRKKMIGLTLKKSYGFLFTGDVLDMVLYIDFLILGFFVSAWELGVYAEAAILARFFLLVPVSIKSIFRKIYCSLASENRFAAISVTVRQTTALLFYLHGLLALYFLYYYPNILNLFFHTSGEEMACLKIFTTIIPGLIFFSAIIAQEPVYEVFKQVGSLQKLTIVTALVNLFLNFNLIPYAGVLGAAVSTAITMVIWFFLFGRAFDKHIKIDKMIYLQAGACVYLIYQSVRWFEAGPVVIFFALPVVLFGLFYLIGFFDFEQKAISAIN